jgi:trimeric autotransporter adhesin
LLNYSTKGAVHFLVRVFAALLLLLFANIAYAQNTISTVAGGPPPNNVAPTAAAATLEGPQAIVRDPFGNFYVITDSGVIYKVTPPATAPSNMSIYAGNNTAGFSANGTAATSTLTNEPYGAAVDANGNLYYSDSNNCVVREIVGGVVETVAGNGTCGFSGDAGPATSASLDFPQGIAIDSSGNLYIADLDNSVIRRVDSSGNITTYAGTPDTTGFPGNGIPATSALLYAPVAVAVDTTGNLFISDENDNVICRVDAASKIITIVAGTGAFGYSGDGGVATAATMAAPDGVTVDSSGNIYIADTENAVIREVFSPANETMPNIITTIVGNHTFGFGGDNGPALSAELSNPAGLFVDSTTGNLWLADYWNNRIRLYSPGNNDQITTVIGSGLVSDGGPATSASFYFPRTPALDPQGDLYVTDAENNRIREVNATSQIISTVVGNGVPCAQPTLPCGDGGLATNASLFMPRTVTIESSGSLLVADDGDNRIREVDGETGIIATIVGSGNRCGTGAGEVPWPCGDGGPALSASLNDARGAVRDAAGNLYFVDAQDNRVREVDTTGTITTIAGDGPDGNAATGCPSNSYTGDGGPAVSATLNCPLGLDMDSQGNLYVADTDNNVIREIDTGTPRIITTIAGNGTAGHTGDGGLATNATLNSPDRVSVNGAGNFFISDSGNNVIRRVDGASKIITAFAGNGTFAFAGDGGPALSASFATPVGVVVDPQGNMYVGDVFNNRIRKVLLNPNISFSSTSVAFGNQPINATAALPLTVTNSGDAPLTISNIAVSEGAFSISANPCPAAPATLAVGAQCVLEIAFMPTQFVSYTGSITVTDNVPASGSMQTINLSGTGGAALSVTVTGSGTVTSSPAGINCPTTCSAVFAGNGQITLTAVPSAGSVFAGWGGDVCEGTASCTFTITAATSVTANFNVSLNFGLMVTEAGTGTGTVTSAPAGISCPTTCSANFASATQVTLTASASANSTFAGWSGGGCTGAGTCVVTVTAATAVTATFNSASPVTIGIGQGSSSTVTTTPGSSAVFGLVLTALPGTTGTVQLTCSSPVASITCNIVPSSITLTGKAINVAIVVETFCKGWVPKFVPMPGAMGNGLGLLLATLCLCGMAWRYKKQPRWAVSFGLLIIFAVGMTACSNVAKSPSGSATPPGNYPLTVTATAPNGGASSINLTLKVQ